MTNRLRRGLGLVATAAVLTTASLAASASTNLIVNGDFDDTNGTWRNNTDMGGDDLMLGGTMPPGWSAMPGLANDIWIGPSNDYALTASPGNGSGYFLDLTGQGNTEPSGGIEQTFATVPGAGYQVTYDIGYSSLYNGYPRDAEAAVEVAVTNSVTKPLLLFNYAPSYDPSAWDSVLDYQFLAGAASTTLEFFTPAEFTQSQYAGLDNVVVTLQSLPPVSPAPEPAELAMLLAGLGFIGGAARRRAQPKSRAVAA